MSLLLIPLIFVCGSTMAALLLSLLFGTLTLFVAVFSLCVGLVLGLLAFVKWRKVLPALGPLNYFDRLMILFFMVFSFRHFLWLVFQNGNSVLTLDSNNFGDIPFHIGFINYLSHGASFWPQNPILSGESYTAPFGVDLFSALLTKVGFPFLYHLPLTGFAASTLLMFAFLFWGGGFALGAFLFASGGLNYMPLILGELKDLQDGKPWGSVITLFTDYGGLWYALPAGLVILWSWRRRFFSDERPLPDFFEGLILGTMPFFNLQTSVFLVFVYLCWVALTRKLSALKVLAWALPPALVEIYFISARFTKPIILWFKPGWMIDNQNVFMYFWSNYGLFLLASVAMVIICLRKLTFLKQILPAVLGIVLCYMWVFSRWEWENIRFMMWCYVLALPVLYELTIKRFTPKFQAFLIFVLFVPGFIAVASMHDPKNKGSEIYTRESYDGACVALEHAKPEERVASAQIHNHPALLCGHPLAAGYPGNLWSWGLNAEEKQLKLSRLMRGDEAWRTLAVELKTRYLYWGPYEVSTYADSTKPWQKAGVKIVGQGDWGIIYDLESEPKK